MQKADQQGQLFCLGEHADRARDTYWSLVRFVVCMFPCTNRDGRFYQSNHFSMPEKREMEYVPIGIEVQMQRSCGLRLFLRRLLLQLLGHRCDCPACRRERVNEAREKVIEF